MHAHTHIHTHTNGIRFFHSYFFYSVLVRWCLPWAPWDNNIISPYPYRNIHPSILLISSSSIIYLSIHFFIHVFIHLFIHPSVHPLICSSIYSSIHPSTDHLLINLSSIIHLSINLFIHLFIHPSICSTFRDSFQRHSLTLAEWPGVNRWELFGHCGLENSEWGRNMQTSLSLIDLALTHKGKTVVEM